VRVWGDHSLVDLGRSVELADRVPPLVSSVDLTNSGRNPFLVDLRGAQTSWLYAQACGVGVQDVLRNYFFGSLLESCS
jgi:hypothetical protein